MTHSELDGSRHEALAAVPLPYPLWGLPVAVAAGTMRPNRGLAVDGAEFGGWIAGSRRTPVGRWCSTRSGIGS